MNNNLPVLESRIRLLLDDAGCIVKDGSALAVPKAESRFDIFSLVWPKETDVSRVLADLLDPTGSHDHGGVFLDLFLETLETRLPSTCQKPEWMNASFWKSATLEESTPSGRRLDVVLRFAGGVVGIENKPWAVDQRSQLSDYAHYLKSEGHENWILIYLSNWAPSTESLATVTAEYLRAQGKLVRISFFGLASWIEACAGACQSATVGWILRDLAKFVRTSINYEVMSTAYQTDIAALVKDSCDFEAALAIAEALPHLKRQRLAPLGSELARAADLLGWTLEWRMDLSRSHTGFTIHSLRVPGKKLRLEWEASELKRFAWGLLGSGFELENDAERLTKQFGPGKSYSGWPWYQDGARAFNIGDRDAPETEVKAWRLVESGAFAIDVIDRVELAFKCLSQCGDQNLPSVTV